MYIEIWKNMKKWKNIEIIWKILNEWAKILKNKEI